MRETPEKARQIINKWVEDQTKEKIQELLQSDNVKVTTRLVLTNAIYLKAAWACAFDAGYTKEAPFQVSEGKEKAVLIMQEKSHRLCNYFAGGGFHWLELPYRDGGLTMVLILPDKKGNLLELKKLTARAIQESLDQLKRTPGSVALPTWKPTGPD